VVEPFSSSFIGTEQTQTINANHMEMCRFPSREDAGYKQIVGELRMFMGNIQERAAKKENEKGKTPEVPKSKLRVNLPSHPLLPVRNQQAEVYIQRN
jgi:hypothetical protein